MMATSNFKCSYHGCPATSDPLDEVLGMTVHDDDPITGDIRQVHPLCKLAWNLERSLKRKIEEAVARIYDSLGPR